MTLLYKPEHLACLNYDNGEKPAAEMLNFSRGKKIDVNMTQTAIVFMMTGQIEVFYENVQDREMKTGQIMLFPAGMKIHISPQNDANVFVLRIKKEIQICDKYTLENLFAQIDRTGIEHSHLLINKKIAEYLQHFTECVDDGLRCCRYFDIKTTELFLLLRAYYSKEELASFFHPMLSTDAAFTDFVWRNYRSAGSVAELAELSTSGLSAFKTKFRRVFGVHATQWLSEQKSKNIYHDLNSTAKSLKQISSDYHFSAVSHLTTFCKEKLGTTPGQIRREKAE